jgi:hypothetical protein
MDLFKSKRLFLLEKRLESLKSKITKTYESEPGKNEDYMNTCTLRNQHQILL